jgi:hypothetical protein
MSDDNRQPAESIVEPTEAQFSIRALFVMMAIVAVLAAIAGAIVRHVEPGTRTRLLAAWGLWLLGSVIWLGIAARQRHAAEKLAGRALLRIPLFDERVPVTSVARRRSNMALSAFFALLMLAFFSGLVADAKSPAVGPIRAFWSLTALGAVSVFWVSRLATSLWWRNNVRFGEFGVLWDRRVMLWDHMVQCDYKENAPNQLQISGIDQNNIDMHLGVVVPPESREAMHAILQSKFVARPEVDIKPPMAALGTMPLSVAVRDKRFLKYIGFILFFMVFGIVGSVLFRGGFTGIREFDQSIFVGLIGMSLCLALLRKVTQPPGVDSIGPPLVRITSSRNWFMAIAAAAAACSLYWIGRTFGVTSELVSYVTGFTFGGMASIFIQAVVRHTIDLRENGMYRFGGVYWPWKEVRLVTWEPTRGKLVLSRGWRKMRTEVAAEQRELVGNVLKEKLAQ